MKSNKAEISSIQFQIPVMFSHIQFNQFIKYQFFSSFNLKNLQVNS